MLLYSSTPLLLPPSSPSTTLVVPVANDIAYSITVVYSYSSQDAHGTDRLVLIWYAFHWWFKHALATQAASDLRLCLRLFFSQASTSRARQPPLGQSLSPVSFHAAVCCQDRALIHSTWRYFAGAVLIWYTVSRLLQQTLVHKPLPFYGLVFVFLSSYNYFFSQRLSKSSVTLTEGKPTAQPFRKQCVSQRALWQASSYHCTRQRANSENPMILLLLLLFCSLAGFHLECTSNSLGATSLWPAGLPKAIK